MVIDPWKLMRYSTHFSHKIRLLVFERSWYREDMHDYFHYYHRFCGSGWEYKGRKSQGQLSECMGRFLDCYCIWLYDCIVPHHFLVWRLQ